MSDYMEQHRPEREPYDPGHNDCFTCGEQTDPKELFFVKDMATGLTGWVCQNSIDDYGFSIITTKAEFNKATRKGTSS